MGALAVITIGIDPHKSSLSAVAVDLSGKALGRRRLLVNAGTLSQLTAWAAGWPARRFAVEGAYGLGQPIAQQLAAAGEQVLDVPATLAAEDQTTILRLLAERRDDLAAERTRILNRLHGLLRDLVPGGAPTDLTAAKAAALVRLVRPATATAACRRQLARALLGDLRRVDARLAENTVQLRDALAATASTLTQIHGLGVVVAAKLRRGPPGAEATPGQRHLRAHPGRPTPMRSQPRWPWPLIP
jgi:transposase